ncbi:serine dehydratase-like isoform 2-T6 [Amazona ochrocephala]
MAAQPSRGQKPFHIVSPVLESLPLSRAAGTKVYMKLENVQPTGSFKIRGIGHLCREAAKKGCSHFVCSSGGSAGLAAAYAGQKLGVPVTVVVPSSTGPDTVRRLQEMGAEVEVSGQVWDDANRRALELVETKGWVSIPPFDHPLVCPGGRAAHHPARHHQRGQVLGSQDRGGAGSGMCPGMPGHLPGGGGCGCGAGCGAVPGGREDAGAAGVRRCPGPALHGAAAAAAARGAAAGPAGLRGGGGVRRQQHPARTAPRPQGPAGAGVMSAEEGGTAEPVRCPLPFRNHGMVWVGKDLKITQFQPPAMGGDASHQTMSPKAGL